VWQRLNELSVLNSCTRAELLDEFEKLQKRVDRLRNFTLLALLLLALAYITGGLK
jgi:hypothetical protein